MILLSLVDVDVYIFNVNSEILQNTESIFLL